jgi:hypothetical protein
MNKLLGTPVVYWPKASDALLADAEPRAAQIASVDATDPKALRVNLAIVEHEGDMRNAMHVPFWQSGDRPKGMAYCELPATVGKYSAADKPADKPAPTSAAQQPQQPHALLSPTQQQTAPAAVQ